MGAAGVSIGVGDGEAFGALLLDEVEAFFELDEEELLLLLPDDEVELFFAVEDEEDEAVPDFFVVDEVVEGFVLLLLVVLLFGLSRFWPVQEASKATPVNTAKKDKADFFIELRCEGAQPVQAAQKPQAFSTVAVCLARIFPQASRTCVRIFLLSVRLLPDPPRFNEGGDVREQVGRGVNNDDGKKITRARPNDAKGQRSGRHGHNGVSHRL